MKVANDYAIHRKMVTYNLHKTLSLIMNKATEERLRLFTERTEAAESAAQARTGVINKAATEYELSNRQLFDVVESYANNPYFIKARLHIGCWGPKFDQRDGRYHYSVIMTKDGITDKNSLEIVVPLAIPYFDKAVITINEWTSGYSPSLLNGHMRDAGYTINTIPHIISMINYVLNIQGVDYGWVKENSSLTILNSPQTLTTFQEIIKESIDNILLDQFI